MLNILNCELAKLKHSKIILLCIIGSFAVPFMLFIESIQTHFEYPERIFTLSDIYANSLLYTMLLMNIMICIAFISYLFSREYMDQTFKTILPVPLSRSVLISSKFVLSFLFTLMINLISWATILVLSWLFRALYGLDGFSIQVMLKWFLLYSASSVFMFATVSPYAYIAMKTKGFVAPMIISAAMVMLSAALCNQDLGALYPWTASYALLHGTLIQKGYPLLLSIFLIVLVSVIGFLLTYYHFIKEDL